MGERKEMGEMKEMGERKEMETGEDGQEMKDVETGEGGQDGTTEAQAERHQEEEETEEQTEEQKTEEQTEQKTEDQKTEDQTEEQERKSSEGQANSNPDAQQEEQPGESSATEAANAIGQQERKADESPAEGSKSPEETGEELVESGWKISIVDPAGKVIVVQIIAQETVAELKLKIQDKEDIPPPQQTLTFKGRQLEDRRQLGEYNITKGSKLRLALVTEEEEAAPLSQQYYNDDEEEVFDEFYDKEVKFTKEEMTKYTLGYAHNQVMRSSSLSTPSFFLSPPPLSLSLFPSLSGGERKLTPHHPPSPPITIPTTPHHPRHHPHTHIRS